MKKKIEDYLISKRILERDIEVLINKFEREYNSYVCEINIIHEGNRYSDGSSNFKTNEVNIKSEFNSLNDL